MFKIENNKVNLTRGDVALIEVKAQNEDGSSYEFRKDEIIRINIFKNKDCSSVVLSKDIIVDKPSTSVTIPLTSKETTIEDVINKPKTYWYEIVLNPGENEQTIIGYDLDGAKEFILYPEAGDE